MQQATAIRTARRRSVNAIGGGIALVVIAGALTALWITERPQPQAPAAPAAPARALPAASPRFADEAAYTPAVEEYTSPALGEDYLPVAPAAPVDTTRPFSSPISSRVLADELANGAGAPLEAGVAQEVIEQSQPAYGPR